MGRDLGLTVRMLAALALAALVALLVVAFLVWIALEVHYMVALFGVVFIALGTQATGRKPKQAKKTRPRTEEDDARLHHTVARVAMMAEVAPPAVKAESQRAPLCWTTTTIRGRPSIHATTGLLDRLDDGQLEAVLAHEISHVVNRDALVMTLVAGAPATFFRHMREENIVGVLVYLGWLIPAMLLMTMSGRVVSRARELAADRGAALLTGSPAAVAGALITLNADITGLRGRDADLRSRSPGDLFNFVPVAEQTGLRRLWATHPPLQKRLDELDAMERALNHPERRR